MLVTLFEFRSSSQDKSLTMMFQGRNLMIKRNFALRIAIAAVGAVAAASVFSACSQTVTPSTTEPAAGGNKTIGIAVADQKSLFYVAAVDGMEQAAEEAGYKLITLSANNNSSQQVNQVQDLITQQVGAIIFIAQDATSAAAGVKLANDAGIPIIAVDQKPESGDGKLATYIATDSVKAAEELCTWLFDQIGGAGDLAILQGPLGATAELQRSEGCDKALGNYPDINVVAMESANWDETEAFTAAQNILTANPNLKAFFGESDAMAMGAAKAAKQDGREGLFFVGIDGFPTMFEAITGGLTQATMAQQPYLMGQMSVKNAVQIAEGKTADVPELQYMDTVLVTKENVADNDPTKFYGPDF
ncbi:sugar ABC transporter substrate-binding protein [Cryobacterium sp. Hh11]|nr:sugar ABC transporter substrate-binding protein [Cryobacterium sp. Hh11]